MNQVGEGEDGGVRRDFLLPQGAFDLFPVPRHHLVIVCALCEEEKMYGDGRSINCIVTANNAFVYLCACAAGKTHGCRR